MLLHGVDLEYICSNVVLLPTACASPCTLSFALGFIDLEII
jgi:hypothetical protein